MFAKFPKRILLNVFYKLFVTAALLLSAAIQAQTVITDPNDPDTVIRIENLPVIVDDRTVVYNVDFRFATGFEVYGPNLDDLDFTNEEDALVAIATVNFALNAEIPGPKFAGESGQRFYYLSPEADDSSGAPLLATVGGEHIEFWDKCKTDCIFGVAGIEDPTDIIMWADFTVADSTGNQPPTANANGPHNGTVGVAITFDGMASNDPDGSIVLYEWDFADGTFATGAAPSHAYDAAGVYNVILTVTDDGGASNTDDTQASIDLGAQPPVADANGPYTGEIDTAVALDGSGSFDPDGSIVSWDWDFGDGFTGTGEMTSHAYSEGGGYVVTLTVMDDSGVSAMDDTMVTIATGNQPPVADAGGPYAGTPGVPVDFNGNGTIDVDGDIVDFDWDFGDGSALGSGATPFHIYAVDGVYTVILTVTDDAGASDSDDTAADISSGNRPPVANAGGPYSGFVDAAITFDGTGSSDPDGIIAAYDWDFGDGNFGTGETTTHTYTTDGIFDVTLMVTDDGGATDSDIRSASIEPASQVPRVITDPNNPDTVIRIENLTIDFNIDGGSGGSRVYNVDFRYESSLDVYGANLDGFPFDGITIEEDALAAMSDVHIP